MGRENRKVLISIKVSTLLLILTTIIIGIVIINTIKENIQKNVELSNNTKYEQTEIIEENKENLVKPEISSRGSNTKEKRHSSIKENNESEKIVLENDQSIEETPKILYGAVAGINFDDFVIENSIEEIKLGSSTEEETTIPIEDVKISKDMDLTIRTGLSRNDFIKLMSGVNEDKANFFEENAGLIYDICEEFDINEIFFCGLIAGESGWRIAENHRRTHNYISLMSGGSLIRFSSLEEGLRKAAEALHNNYLTEGGRFYYGKTLAAVKTRFCPSSTTWVNLIYGNMKLILD